MWKFSNIAVVPEEISDLSLIYGGDSLRARFTQNPLHAWRRAPHGFYHEPDLTETVTSQNRLIREDITIGGQLVWPWLEEMARGKVMWVTSLYVHASTQNLSFISTPGGFTSPANIFHRKLQMVVAFSDPQLAALWRLTWGGKKIDVKKMSHKLRL